ncbi:MAG TPA: right-handed parallel beta-helix repeat-containing protein, partial [Candidatus Binataceae bacterium]|nr:right-handed parallel beta-helix repeat-containing protein [Candidatus Binataceae bacterium]
GILLGANATVTDVHAVGNGGAGIVVGNASLVTHNTVSSNTGVGIDVTGQGSTVVDNSVYNNGGYGLQLHDVSSSFAHNVFMGNDGNSTVGSSAPPQVAPAASGIQVQIGSNLCNGVSCP